MTENPSPRDPLEALRLPALPLAPDPIFAARLRARLAAELHPTDPEGTTMSATTLADVPRTAPQDVPTPVGVVPYVSVPDGEAAIIWYARTFDAHLSGDPIVMDDGRIGHAELVINGGMLYLAEAFPEYGFNAPVLGELPSVTMHLTVPDVDVLVAHAVDEGATLERPPSDNPYGRGGSFIDPFGHRWLVHQDAAAADSTAADSGTGKTDAVASVGAAGADAAGVATGAGIAEGASGADMAAGIADPDLAASQGASDRPPLNGEGHGDVSYLTLMVPDSTRARAFYGSVLGWTFNHGRVDDGWEVAGVQPMTGMWGAGDTVEVPTMIPMYRVDDIASAVERVRAAGGTATDPAQESYGMSSECVDDQGAHFYLGQH